MAFTSNQTSQNEEIWVGDLLNGHFKATKWPFCRFNSGLDLTCISQFLCNRVKSSFYCPVKTSGRLAPLYSMSGLLWPTFTSQQVCPICAYLRCSHLPQGATFDQKLRWWSSDWFTRLIHAALICLWLWNECFLFGYSKMNFSIFWVLTLIENRFKVVSGHSSRLYPLLQFSSWPTVTRVIIVYESRPS